MTPANRSPKAGGALPAPASRAMAVTGAAPAATGSVWLVGQTSARAQRSGRYLPGSVAHPARMMPALARTAIATYTRLGDLVLDPMCGIGTTLVEAVHCGRDAAGIEYEPRWAALAADNLRLAENTGAAGRATVATGDSRQATDLLPAELTGRVRLLLTSPPYGAAAHGRVNVPRTEKVRKWYHRYSDHPPGPAASANLARQSLPQLLDGFREILLGCLPLLAPDAAVVLTVRPYRSSGQLIDLPGAVLHTATSVGLRPVGRYAALLAGVHPDRIVPRGSFFQMANVRAARAAGTPLRVIAHEDVLVLRTPGSALCKPPRHPLGTGRPVAAFPEDAEGATDGQ
jgi:modification methylase